MSIHKHKHDLIAWADQRIRDMLDAPRMWGETLETVELQVLMLLEARALAVDPSREARQPRRIFDAYVKVLAERFNVRPPQPVHRFVDEDESRFVAIMRALTAALSDESEGTDSGFFERSYLGLELNFKPDEAVAARTVTGFYEDFRRATRSLARMGGGRTGRVEKAIEVETDFELEDMEITPQNGVPARARIMLGAPRGQKNWVGETQVRTALHQMVEVAERAGAGVGRDLERFGEELDPEIRTRALIQTLRVLPHRGIDEVKLGGTLIGRATPVCFRANHDRAVRAAIAVDTKPSAYDNHGSIRAIDLDRGFILHNYHGRRIPCYLSPDRSEEVTQVGVRAHIVGKLYKPRDAQWFVMIEKITIEPPLTQAAASKARSLKVVKGRRASLRR
mgnify:CR=1 FL=1